MSKTKPTDSQIDVLMSDWLGNLRQKENGNFVHKGEGGISRENKASASDYILGDDVNALEDLELIKRSRMAAEQVVNAVMAEPVHITVGNNVSYHGKQDGRHIINIATDYFDDTTISRKEKAGIMMGLAAHEAAHGVYTDEKAQKKAIESEDADLRELKHEVFNIIEDERIEYLLGDDYPGFAASIGETKGYFFKKLLNDMKAKGVEQPTEPLPKLIKALMQAVRYPSEMTREQAEENFDELDCIRRILTPFPLSTEAVWDATDRVMDVVREMAKKKAKDEKNQPQGGQGGQSGDQQGQDQQQQNQPQGGGQGSGKPSPKKEPTKKEVQKALSDMLSSKQMKGMMEAVKKDENKSSGRNSSVQLGYTEDEYVNNDDSETENGGPGHPKVFVFKPDGDSAAYLNAMKEIRAFVPAMKKALACRSQEQEYILQGLPSGRMNCNKLAGLRAGNKHIFTRQGSITSSSASVVILIDQSGSMGGTRQMEARKAAILVKEALDHVANVRYFCYGYTSDRIDVYAENGKTAKWSLGGTHATGGTPTGMAMEVAANRVRRYTDSPCLMLVLTDGAPDSNATVMEQDRELPKKKIYPIGIGIQSSSVRNGFKEYVVMEDISEFAVKLGQLTKGRLEKMLVRKDSNF